jgi:coenzyme F420 hydrogenase subunit beta
LELTYSQSWGYIQSYRPWAVHLWPDGTGEMADISCGDAWHKHVDGIGMGSSIVVVRTEVGRRYIQAAMRDGYINLERVDRIVIMKAQKNIIIKRGAIWGRIMCMRLLGMPTPNHREYNLFKSWLKLSHYEKVRSIIGTFRRIIVYKYYKPLDYRVVGKDK